MKILKSNEVRLKYAWRKGELITEENCEDIELEIKRITPREERRSFFLE